LSASLDDQPSGTADTHSPATAKDCSE